MNDNLPKEPTATFWHITSYVSIDRIEPIILAHSRMIKYAYWILHNRDNKMPHTHIYLKLNCSRHGREVKNWFTDDENSNAGYIKNTYSESSSIDYLLHRNQDSISKGKALYYPEELHYFNTDYDILMGTSNIPFRIVEDMSNGVALFDLVRKYGKDFVYHYNCYRSLLNDISIENKTLRDIHSLLEEVAILRLQKENLEDIVNRYKPVQSTLFD